MSRGSDDQSSGASTVSFGGETLKATIAKFTMALSGFIGTVVFARVLGPTSFGGFYLLLSVVQMTDRPFKGLERAIKKRFAQDDTDNGEILGILIGFATFWTSVVLLAGWAFRSQLSEYTGVDNAIIPFAVLVVGLLGTTPLTLIQAKGKVGAAEWADAVRSYLTLPLQVAFVFLGFGAAGMAYGLAGATALVAPVGLYYVTARPVIPSKSTVLHVWTFAKYSIPSGFVGKAYDRFDLLLLGYLLTPAAVANYEVAAMLTLPATFVASAASGLLMPRISQLVSRGEGVAQDISRTLAFSSILSIPIFFGALAIPNALVVTVYGGEYAGAGLMLITIAVYRVVGTQTEPMLQSLDGLDMPQMTFKLSSIALAINIPLGILLVAEIGAVGVVIATIVAELVRYIGAGYVLITNVEGVGLFSTAIKHQIIAGLVMFFIVSGLSSIITISSWVDLLFVVSIGALSYSMLLMTISEKLRETLSGTFEETEYETHVQRILDLFEFPR